MTSKQFINSLAKGQEDVLQLFLDLLYKHKTEYCLIGGLAVNAYVTPVVSLDLDLVVVTNSLKELRESAKEKFEIEDFPHSINFKSPKSDLRIQIQTDPRYQKFIPRATLKNVLGYQMKVACLEDVLQGKLWAYSDDKRRRSKHQKDLADIYRLTEEYPDLNKLLPESLKNEENERSNIET